jgi:hypothetical protein
VFALLFIFLPLLLAQMVLVDRGGFPVVPAIPSLLHNIVALTAVFLLPMACVAAITSSFAQAMLSILGIAGGIAGIEMAFNYAGTVSATLGVPRRSPMFIDLLLIGIALAIFSAVVLVQYRRRATRTSIVILSGLALLLIAIQLVVPGSPAAAAGYPANAPGAAPSVAINVADSAIRTLFIPKNPRTAVYNLPLQFSNLPAGTSYMREAIRYTLTASDGFTWRSEWIIAYGWVPTDPRVRTSAVIDIPWSVHDRFMGGPVSVRLEFLMTQMEDAAPLTYTLSTTEQAVPGVGSCALRENLEYFSCLTLFTQRQLFNVKTFRNTTPCEATEEISSTPVTLPPGRLVHAEGGFGVTGRAAILLPVLSPIRTQRIFLSPHPDEPFGHLCPGAPITFNGKVSKGRLQLETASATIVLKDRPGPVGP